MPRVSDSELYARGAATLLASWAQYACGLSGASLLRLRGVAAAVFPDKPQRSVYNNALLDRDLGPDERAAAIDAMHAAYSAAGIERYAAWVHESDEGMRSELIARGYTLDTSTRAMAMSLDDDVVPPAGEADLAEADLAEHLRTFGLSERLLSGVDPNAFHVLVGRLSGKNVATGLALDHDGDCGVYNIGTIETARRRGLGTALTARLLHDAAARGCTTASLQSTPIAERVYAAVGFRDLGRFLEYVP
jgi:ribosomal protein S18 acetylase RimI-like enzyme